MTIDTRSAPSGLEIALRKVFNREKPHLDEQTAELLRRYGTTKPEEIVRRQKRHRPIT